MATSRKSAARPEPGVASVPSLQPTRSAPSTIYQMQIALLRSQLATVQATLEQERKQRQAVIDRYERVIDRQ